MGPELNLLTGSPDPIFSARQFLVSFDAEGMINGMFRRSALQAIPHCKSFAAIPSVSLVLLVRTNRNVSLSRESQREVALDV